MGDPDDDEECTLFRRQDIRFQAAPSPSPSPPPPRNAMSSPRLELLLDHLGLRDFLISTPLPPLDEDLCTAFIKTFQRKPALIDGGQGTVHGRRIDLCAHSVHHYTGLPLGDSRRRRSPPPLGRPSPSPSPPLRTSPRLASPGNVSMLREMFPSKKTGSGGDCYLPRISRRIDDADEFAEIARMVMAKLLCRAEGRDMAEATVLVGMRYSLATGTVMPWAVLLARRMVEAVIRGKERRGMFVFGHWLSGLIRHQLDDGGRGSGKRSASSVEEEEGGKASRGKQRKYESQAWSEQPGGGGEAGGAARWQPVEAGGAAQASNWQPVKAEAGGAVEERLRSPTERTASIEEGEMETGKDRAEEEQVGSKEKDTEAGGAAEERLQFPASIKIEGGDREQVGSETLEKEAEVPEEAEELPDEAANSALPVLAPCSSASGEETSPPPVDRDKAAEEAEEEVLPAALEKEEELGCRSPWLVKVLEDVAGAITGGAMEHQEAIASENVGGDVDTDVRDAAAPLDPDPDPVDVDHDSEAEKPLTGGGPSFTGAEYSSSGKEAVYRKAALLSELVTLKQELLILESSGSSSEELAAVAALEEENRKLEEEMAEMAEMQRTLEEAAAERKAYELSLGAPKYFLRKLRNEYIAVKKKLQALQVCSPSSS